MIWWSCAFACLQRSIGCRKCALLAAILLFHSCFFTHGINQEWANLPNGRVICRKSKTPASRKTTLLCQYKYGKECKFYIKWCTAVFGMEFLFDFVVTENLDSMLLKLCELILPSVHFSGLRGGMILYELHYREKKIHGNMLWFLQKWVVHWYFKLWVFTFWNLSSKI